MLLPRSGISAHLRQKHGSPAQLVQLRTGCSWLPSVAKVFRHQEGLRHLLASGWLISTAGLASLFRMTTPSRSSSSPCILHCMHTLGVMRPPMTKLGNWRSVARISSTVSSSFSALVSSSVFLSMQICGKQVSQNMCLSWYVYTSSSCAHPHLLPGTPKENRRSLNRRSKEHGAMSLMGHKQESKHVTWRFSQFSPGIPFLYAYI